jgi:hypothetical protein
MKEKEIVKLAREYVDEEMENLGSDSLGFDYQILQQKEFIHIVKWLIKKKLIPEYMDIKELGVLIDSMTTVCEPNENVVAPESKFLRHGFGHNVDKFYPENEIEDKTDKQLAEDAWQILYYSELLNDKEKTNIAKKIKNRYKKEK